MIGHPTGEHTLYEWQTLSGYVWKRFGDDDTQAKYKGEVENEVPNGFGIWISPYEIKYVGEWKDGKKNGHGTLYHPAGGQYYGEWKEGNFWNGSQNYGKTLITWENGKIIKKEPHPQN